MPGKETTLLLVNYSALVVLENWIVSCNYQINRTHIESRLELIGVAIRYLFEAFQRYQLMLQYLIILHILTYLLLTRTLQLQFRIICRILIFSFQYLSHPGLLLNPLDHFLVFTSLFLAHVSIVSFVY